MKISNDILERQDRRTQALATIFRENPRPFGQAGGSSISKACWTFAFSAMIVLGGGNYTMPLPRIAVELIAAACIAASLRPPSSKRGRLSPLDAVLPAVFLFLFLQCIPLPPSVWTALPGREIALRIDTEVFGRALWRPLTMDPTATFHNAIAIIPAVAGYLSVRTGNEVRIQAILNGVTAAGLLALMLAVADLLLPAAKILDFYPWSDRPWPVGFFTNHNHQGIFLACMIPMSGADLLHRVEPWMHIGQRRLHTALWLAASSAFTVLALSTGSRATAALLPLSLLGSHILTKRPYRWQRAGSALLIGCIALAVAGLGGDAVLSAFGRAPMEADQRWTFFNDSWQAIGHFWPWGSGIGTFVDAFAMHEPLSSLSQRYLNHAHNEYLELVLEGGVPAIVLIVAIVGTTANAIARCFRHPLTKAPNHRIAGLATVPIGLLLLHSLVDYPLRTYALTIVAAICLGLVANANAGTSKFAVRHTNAS